ASAKPRVAGRENRQRTREQNDGEETQGIDAEKRRKLHQRQRGEKSVADEIPGKPGQHMAAGIFAEADSDGEREDPARSRLPQQHGQRASRGEEQGHAARQRRQDKGDQPAVPPGLDEERFGDPIKPGEEIAETEEKSNDSGGFQPLPE